MINIFNVFYIDNPEFKLNDISKNIRAAREFWMFDLKLLNAKIFGNDDADSLCITKGKIEYVGREKYGQAKRVVDLEGSCVIPGFVDSHTHLLNLGDLAIDLTGLSREQVIRRMQEEAIGKDLVIGRGWDESFWEDRSYLTIEEVDQISKPAFLIRVDGHMAVANRKALDLIGMRSKSDGILKEDDMKLIRKMQTKSKASVSNSLMKAFKVCFSKGVTCIRDIVDRSTFYAYTELPSEVKKPNVKLAVYYEEFEDNMLNYDEFWGVKLFLDGSIGARTAAVSSWEADNLLIKKDKLNVIAEEFWKKGIPIAAHAIGDLAIDLALDVMTKCKDRRIKNSVEHAELVREEFLPIMKNVLISCQPNFLQWSKKGGLYEQRLGRAWLCSNNPYRLMINNGIKLSFGSDCMPFGPCYGIHHAVNSECYEQRIELDEAIRCYTIESAYLCNYDEVSGSIERGKDADLVIFKQDFLSDKQKIIDQKPVATLLKGEVVYGSLPARSS